MLQSDFILMKTAYIKGNILTSVVVHKQSHPYFISFVCFRKNRPSNIGFVKNLEWLTSIP